MNSIIFIVDSLVFIFDLIAIIVCKEDNTRKWYIAGALWVLFVFALCAFAIKA